jgi:N-sulfoglucosamine sulfohydrolase
MKPLHLLLLALALVISSHVSAAEAKRPNILFIIFDDWNGSTHAGAYGCDWIKTPNFDRVAREGALFKNAFTSNPKCSPCRASILTGRNTWQLKEAVSHGGLFPAGFEVYPDLLEKSGYTVGLTGKGWGPGNFKETGRTRNPAGPSFDKLTQDVPASGIGKLDYPGNFGEFLKQRDKSKPFCFWMGFAEPHRAYELGSGLKAGKKLEDVKVPKFLPDTEIVRSDLLDYAVEVEWGDTQIGRALKVLDESGEAENTLVVITSDHGMPFPFVKGQIHEDGFHLPLAMRWPAAMKPGRVVEDFVNVRDLAPTYMELAGLKPHEQMTGKSLAAILRSEKSGWIEDRDIMLVGKERHDIGRVYDEGYPVRAIRTKEFLYVHNFHPERWPACDPETDFGNCDPSPTKEVLKALRGHFYELSFGKRLPDELYRITDDPECVRNLANDLAFKEKVGELSYQMMQLLKAEGDPRALGQFEVFDDYHYLGGRKKGYETWLKMQEETTLAELKKRLEEEAAKPPVAKGKGKGKAAKSEEN